MKKKLLSVFLAICLLFGLVACQQPVQPTEPATEATQPTTEPTQEPTEQTSNPGQDWHPLAQATSDVWPGSSISAFLPQPDVEWMALMDGAEYATIYIEYTAENGETLRIYQEELLRAGFDYQVQQLGGEFLGRNAQGDVVQLEHRKFSYTNAFYIITFCAAASNRTTEWADLLDLCVPQHADTVPAPPSDRWLYTVGQNDHHFVYLKDTDRDSILQYIQSLQDYGYDDVKVMEDDGKSIVFKATGQFETQWDMYGTPQGVYRYYTVSVEFDPAENSKREGYSAFVCFNKGV